MTLETLFAKYRLRNLRDASPNTLRLWQIALRMFDRHLGRAATIDDLTDDVLCEFSTWRVASVSPATCNRDLASLLALWRWACKSGIVDRWPDVPLLREPRQTPIAWTQDEFDLIMQAANDCPGRIGPFPASTWWKSLLLVCFDTGERIGAVMDLHWDSVDLVSRWIVFPASSRKGRREDNAVMISEGTARSLRMMFRTSGRVFPWPCDRSLLWSRFGTLLESAGLPHDRRRKFHCIRRTTASHYESAGGNATELLKHASRSHTKAYLDPRITGKNHAIDLLWRPKYG